MLQLFPKVGFEYPAPHAVGTGFLDST